jgi:tetratricopeptide (TPR) repeat protein
VVGASPAQAAPWLDAAVLGLRAGDAADVPACGRRVCVLAVVHGADEVAARADVFMPERTRGYTPGAGAEADAENAAEVRPAEMSMSAYAPFHSASASDFSPAELLSDLPAAPATDPPADTEPYLQTLTRSVCLENALSARSTGNDILTDPGAPRKKLHAAMSSYHAALTWLRRASASPSEAGAEPDMLADLAARTRLNIAHAYATLGDWKAVHLFADTVLQDCPGSAKAFYRRGQACAKLGMFLLAIRDLEKALEFAPGDPHVTRELAVTRRYHARLLKNTRKDFAETYNVMVSSPIYSIIPDT